MCTVHDDESSVAVLKGTASGPGSIVPSIFLPSHDMMMVTSWRSCGDGPHSPYQVPTSGCPSCAKSEVRLKPDATTEKSTRQPSTSLRGLRPLPLGLPGTGS